MNCASSCTCRGDFKLRSSYSACIHQCLNALQVDASSLQQALDLGCATGLSSRQLLADFPGLQHVTGIDLSPHFLAVGVYEQEQRVAVSLPEAIITGALYMEKGRSIPKRSELHSLHVEHNGRENRSQSHFQSPIADMSIASYCDSRLPAALQAMMAKPECMLRSCMLPWSRIMSFVVYGLRLFAP